MVTGVLPPPPPLRMLHAFLFIAPRVQHSAARRFASSLTASRRLVSIDEMNEMIEIDETSGY